MRFRLNLPLVKRFGRGSRISIETLEGRTLLAAPAITATAFEFETGQAFKVTFSSNVGASVSNADLVLYNLSDRTTVPASKIAVSYDSAANVATFTFPGFSGGLLPEANYQATLYASQITDAASVPLSSNSASGFYVYTADANRDRRVDSIDFNSLAANFGAVGKTFSQGNFNYSGAVDTTDFNLLVARFGVTRSASPPAPRAMDVTTFNASPEGSADHFEQEHFDHLNVIWAGGRFFAMGTDNHRGEIAAKGNSLAVYYNNLTVNIGGSDGFTRADDIQQYVTDNFTSNGQQPTWIVLNEISGSQWPGNAGYRQWLKDCVWKLHVVYGHEVVLYSPFQNPGANGDSWQFLAQHCYIAAEQYLDGAEINSHGNSVSWAQSQYQTTKTAYMNLGVPASRLWLGEHFGQTIAGTGWGRGGVSVADWDAAIVARGQGARNVAFAGFISYAWGKNNMGVSDAEMLHFEDTYLTVPLP